MNRRFFEDDTPGDLHWAELLGVQILNALALVLLVLFWPALAVGRGLPEMVRAMRRKALARRLTGPGLATPRAS